MVGIGRMIVLIGIDGIPFLVSNCLYSLNWVIDSQVIGKFNNVWLSSSSLSLNHETNWLCDPGLSRRKISELTTCALTLPSVSRRKRDDDTSCRNVLKLTNGGSSIAEVTQVSNMLCRHSKPSNVTSIRWGSCFLIEDRHLLAMVDKPELKSKLRPNSVGILLRVVNLSDETESRLCLLERLFWWWNILH